MKRTHNVEIRLSEFINSHGQTPPDDWTDFICWGSTTGIFSDLCFICRDSSFYFKECKFLDPRSNLLESVCACRECGSDIEENLENPKEETGVEFKTVQGPPELKRATKLKIDKYFLEGELPVEYQLYTELSSRENRCLFCDGGIGFHLGKGFFSLSLPINSYSNRISGPAKMCTYCTNYAHEQSYIGKKGQNFAMGVILEDSCAKCGTPYPITNEEFDARMAFKTIGNHLCHDCLSKAGLIRELRMVVEPCPNQDCLIEIIIDRTLHPEHIAKMLCEKCMGLDPGDKIFYEIGEGEVVVILKRGTDLLYYYQIRINTERQQKILGRCKKSFKDPSLAMIEGVQHGKAIWRDLYENEKQKQNRLNM